MSRLAVILAAVVVLLVVLLVVLSGRSGERSQSHVEKVVAVGNLAN